MTTIHAIILAIIEGLTEYLPISSTGHMIIASSLMGIVHDDFTKFFTVSIQFGAIISVLVLYWRQFLQDFGFYVKLLAAFIPAAVIGFLLNDFIDALLENVIVVAVSLLLGGVLLLFVDKIFENNEIEPEELDSKKAFKIGLFQCIAMIPGVSRSAATIIGGLTQKLTRKKAAEFSFFLAVPTMFAASLYKLFKFVDEGGGFQANQVHLLLIGNLVAFLVGVFAIRFFIEFLTLRGFRMFGYYRIALGLIILVLYFMGIDLTIV